MPIIDVKELFSIAIENGNKVIEIEPGHHEVDDRIAEVAVNHLQVATLVEPFADADADVKQPEPVKQKRTRGKGVKNAAVSNEGTS